MAGRQMSSELHVRALEAGDAAAWARAQRFAREQLWQRAWLHACLEDADARAHARFVEALLGERLVGLAALREKGTGRRTVFVDALLPGVVTRLLRELKRPLLAVAARAHLAELSRQGGRLEAVELLMVRPRGPVAAVPSSSGGGTRPHLLFLTERLAWLEPAREGAALAAEIDDPELRTRSLVIEIPENDTTARHRLVQLGFRGTHALVRVGLS